MKFFKGKNLRDLIKTSQEKEYDPSREERYEEKTAAKKYDYPLFEPEQIKGVKMQDDEIHRLWLVYKFGGQWEGKHYAPESPVLMGKLLNTQIPLIYKAALSRKTSLWLKVDST